MSFLNPLAFLFLITAPLLVLLYFLKLKRPKIMVPSTLLWQKVIEDMRVNSPFQKLKRSLLLLLQLLALLAVIAALTRPLLRVRDNANESIIVIMDNSASMMALEKGGQTRLELAKAEVLELADHLSKEDEMLLIVFNSRARVASGFTGNKRKLRDSLDKIKPTECSSKIESALLLAKSICNSRSHPRVLLFSDGAFEKSGNIDMPVEVEYQTIGSSQPNLAITGLDIRRSINDRDKIEMFVAVENLSTKLFEGNMIVRLNDDILDTKYFSVGPEETLSQIFETTLQSEGNIQVEIETEDALACDNSAWKMVSAPAHQQILLVGENTFFLERAFKSSPGVTCRAVASVEYDDQEMTGFSTVIWNSVANPQVAPCNNIYIGCFPNIEGVKQGEIMNAPDIAGWDNTHPINRFLDFDNLILSSTYAMELPEYGITLLRSSRTSLVAMLEMEEGGICITGFDPMKSNWPLLVSFPLFLNNCLDYFEELRTRKIKSNISVGETITVPPSDSVPVIEMPDGHKENMNMNSAGDYSFSDVSKCGIYTIHVPNRKNHSIAVNLFDRNESLLETVENPVIGERQLKVVQMNKQINREFWKYITMILAALLLIEWVVYHRRLFA